MECATLLALATVLLAPLAACRSLPEVSSDSSDSYDSTELKTVVTSASDIADYLLPFLRRQDTADRSGELNLLAKVTHDDQVEILPLNAHHLNKDGKSPLALILGTHDRIRNKRKKYPRYYKKRVNYEASGHDSNVVVLKVNDKITEPESSLQNESSDIKNKVEHEVHNADESDKEQHNNNFEPIDQEHKVDDTDLSDKERKHEIDNKNPTDPEKQTHSNEDPTEADETDKDFSNTVQHNPYNSYFIDEQKYDLHKTEDQVKVHKNRYDDKSIEVHEVKEDQHNDKSVEVDVENSVENNSLDVSDKNQDLNELVKEDLNVDKFDEQVSGEDADVLFKIIAEQLGVTSTELGDELTINTDNDVSSDDSDDDSKEKYTVRLEQLDISSNELNQVDKEQSLNFNESSDTSKINEETKNTGVARDIIGIIEKVTHKRDDRHEPFVGTNKYYNLSFLFNK